ncbi:MAG: ABC transporter ATP-binding protein [Acetobacteraceae bacterium]|nr:ABC transporter ATP-binding protein [Acetobacteraceae bacterium]
MAGIATGATTGAPVVEVEGLCVSARAADGRDISIVQDASFRIGKGEVLALIGESGSGKTTIALSLMGYARPGCRISGGRISVGGTEILSLAPHALRALRGRRVAYVAQSAAAAFNPARSIMAQVTEVARIHATSSVAEAEAKARKLFRDLALPDPDHIGERYPHQVSGGQLQRLMAAMALIAEPELVILDEPTTALDVTTQIEVLRAFRHVVRERGTTGVYVSHDLAVVAQMADRIAVLRDGTIREVGPTPKIITEPENPYTQSLLAAARPVPRGDAAPDPAAQALLEVEGLSAGYGRLPVLEDIALRIPRGAALGVIGESGCGKSTLARVVAGLLPWSAGAVRLGGAALAPDIGGRTADQLRRVQLVFQSADTALNPARSIQRILGRPLRKFHGLSGEPLRRRTLELLDLVQLPARLADRLPGALSGGQKQRVNLARALAAEPDLILCDEVTSALDTVVGAAILELMHKLRRELGVSYMFISHDLHTVRAVCDEVMVLYAGRTVEQGSRQAIETAPWHPYAQLLFSSVPELRPGWLDSRPPRPEGEVPIAGRAGPACAFFPRCPVRIDPTCKTVRPPVRTLSKGSSIACHRQETELTDLS